MSATADPIIPGDTLHKGFKNNNGLVTPRASPEPCNGTGAAGGGAGAAGGDGAAGGSSGQELELILKCGKDEHRKVLGLGDVDPDAYAEEEAIEKAVWNRGTDFHPKYNKAKNAQKAFNRIIEAGEALECRSGLIDDLKDWDGDGGDFETEEEVPYPPPNISKMYDEATVHIAHLQKNPKSKAALRGLDDLNDQIKKINKEDGLEKIDQWVIDYKTIQGFYEEAMPFIRILKKRPSDKEATYQIVEINEKLAIFNHKNYYPQWEMYRDIVIPKVPTRATPETKDTKCKPGFTEKGERILGMAPTETIDVMGKPSMTRCRFLVEKKGDLNPMVFEDAADIGEEATRGYLEELPKSERNDIRSKMNEYSPKDRKGFVKVKAVACDGSDNQRGFQYLGQREPADLGLSKLTFPKVASQEEKEAQNQDQEGAREETGAQEVQIGEAAQ
ncbi:hypothetical protein K432DRAFT_408241 [Lepidopterella palustris CBS 459.81]|uniref:Uncharacterized protein n=1 Tax=Lepidopterella palustris CBS 459.81 TaxID=1314670 RepID=A0A8E2E323_9PEZI|nr:hypothetical protein K432DRAFT_408241 [Lepidopterella palustris CBS 459.81]